MAGPNKKMHVSDEEVLYELLQENEHSNIYESEYSSGSEISVNILSCGKQNVSSDEEENVCDHSSLSFHRNHLNIKKLIKTLIKGRGRME
jgi:hypothetical protein